MSAARTRAGTASPLSIAPTLRNRPRLKPGGHCVLTIYGDRMGCRICCKHLDCAVVEHPMLGPVAGHMGTIDRIEGLHKRSSVDPCQEALAVHGSVGVPPEPVVRPEEVTRGNDVIIGTDYLPAQRALGSASEDQCHVTPAQRLWRSAAGAAWGAGRLHGLVGRRRSLNRTSLSDARHALKGRRLLHDDPPSIIHPSQVERGPDL